MLGSHIEQLLKKCCDFINENRSVLVLHKGIAYFLSLYNLRKQE